MQAVSEVGWVKNYLTATKSDHMTLAQSPPGAKAPGLGCKGGGRPLRVRFTGLRALSPTLERRAEAAQGVTIVYESPVV